MNVISVLNDISNRPNSLLFSEEQAVLSVRLSDHFHPRRTTGGHDETIYASAEDATARRQVRFWGINE